MFVKDDEKENEKIKCSCHKKDGKNPFWRMDSILQVQDKDFHEICILITKIGQLKKYT